MSEKFKLFWLGIFVIIALVIAGWLLLFLKPSVGDGNLYLTVRFSNIDKITPGTRVTFAGKPVGEVKEIREIKNLRDGPSDEFGNLYIYELLLEVDSSIKVFTYDEIVFASSGLLGEKSIVIMPKSAPFSAPPAKEVTSEILYARSTDKLEATLNQVATVAKGLENTMEEISQFLLANSEDFNIALKSFSKTSDSVHSLFTRANEVDFIGKTTDVMDIGRTTFVKMDNFFSDTLERDLVGNLSTCLCGVRDAAQELVSPKGSLGKLVNNDCFYQQLTTLMCKFETLLNDLTQYGLLFQYDRGWQRAQRVKKCQRCPPCPEEFQCFNNALSEINESLKLVLSQLESKEAVDPLLFMQTFRELVCKMEAAQQNLYKEKLSERQL